MHARARQLVVLATWIAMLLACSAHSSALNPSLSLSQYAHTAWTAQDGFSVGAIFAMAQTHDGYLWLGSEFGLFRFDGIRAVRWQPPAGQQLPQKPYALLVTRDGTLWIGTFAGLVSWDGAKLTRYPEVGGQFVTSLLEDRAGTVWVGTMFDSPATRTGRLCAIRSGHAECYGEDGIFGSFVWSLLEDSSGTLWAGAESGVWRWKPGAPKRFAMPAMRVGDLVKSDEGQILIGVSGAGLKRVLGGKLESYPVQSAMNRTALLPEHEIDSNKLLRDRDGGLWIGTHQRGLIHIHNGTTDIFTKSDGLSGDISCSLFEDREGNIWFASSRGLDRFRELPVSTISAKQGLSSGLLSSLVAGKDGSIWIATHDGLTQWRNGQTTVLHKANGLPDNFVQSLFEDNRGRLWATFPGHRLSYLKDGKFLRVRGGPSDEVYSIAGDDEENLWLSGNKGLSHVRGGRLIEHFPWSAMGRHQQAKVVVPDGGGVWLAFWAEAGVLYWKDGKVRASYTAVDGLGKGSVGGIQFDQSGALWAATQEGGLSRIKDGRVVTLTTKNGLPCDTIHWSVEDNHRSLWLMTVCGLVRIARSELDAWIADPNRRIETALWDAADGVGITAVSPAYYNPPVAKASDGALWFLGPEGVSVVDPDRLVVNSLPPPIHIEQIIADSQTHWQNLPGAAVSVVPLPPRIHDLEIDYTALSLAAPEKMRFRVKLEGQDKDWRVPTNPRHAHYTNLAPGTYRFRVIACNNSGVWNNQGDALEFSVARAYYQTSWFRSLCAAIFLAFFWMLHHIRVRQVARQFNMTLEARVGERTRIARELHDTLLQSFHGLLVRFQSVLQLLPERPHEARQRLESTIEQAADAITEARDAVQELRSSTFISNELALTLKTLGEELAINELNHTSAHFHVEVFGSPRDLHPIVRDEVYRIAAEAMHNAFAHALAHQIDLEIRYDDRVLFLRIHDDGKGIDPQVLLGGGQTGHYGMRGMHERARLLGGKLEVWSERGAGTKIELTIPAPNAYAMLAHRRSWLMRFSRTGKNKEIKIES